MSQIDKIISNIPEKYIYHREGDSIVLLHGDCLDILPLLEPNSVDLVLTDPPYNIKKDSWDDIHDYINWLTLRFFHIQEALKFNGSFYWFHSEMPVIAELMQWLKKNSNFIFRQFITWNKRFEGSPKKGYLDGYVQVEGLRNYQQLAEYILYYTFQDNTGLETVMLDVNNFKPLRDYFRKLQDYIGLGLKQINNKLSHRKAEHCFYWKTTQWDLPTREVYMELCIAFAIKGWSHFREYEDLRQEYEDLRQEYEDLRYVFNNQGTHHSVWDYDFAGKEGHVTPKPLDLISNILLHSSNKESVILDPFLGSGTTAVAAKQLGRKCIGIEIEAKYLDIAIERLRQEVLF